MSKSIDIRENDESVPVTKVIYTEKSYVSDSNCMLTNSLSIFDDNGKEINVE